MLRRLAAALLSTGVVLAALLLLARRPPLETPRGSSAAGARAAVVVGPVAAGHRSLVFVSSPLDGAGWEPPLAVTRDVRAVAVAPRELLLVTPGGVLRRTLGKEREGREELSAPGLPKAFDFEVLSASPVGGGLWILGVSSAGALRGVEWRASAQQPLAGLPETSGQVVAAVAAAPAERPLVAWIERGREDRRSLRWHLAGAMFQVEDVAGSSLSVVAQGDDATLYFLRQVGEEVAPARVVATRGGPPSVEELELSVQGPLRITGVTGLQPEGEAAQLFVSDGSRLRLFREAADGRFVEGGFAEGAYGTLAYDLRFATPTMLLVMLGLGVIISRLLRRWRERHTPQHILEGLPLAPILPRAAAAVIDAAMAAAIAAVVYWILMSPGEQALARGLVTTAIKSFVTGEASAAVDWLQTNVLVLLFPYILIAYHTVGESVCGRTPGKALFALHVIDFRGCSADPGGCFARSVLRLADLGLGGLLGLVLVLCTRRRQRLGDLVAGTLVVRDRRRG
ncbi:MAG: RDD family protein [Planctomycetota bacterium]